MHFVEDHTNTILKHTYIWYEMQLKTDFHNILRETPIMPNTSIKEQFKLMEHVKLNTDHNFWDFGEMEGVIDECPDSMRHGMEEVSKNKDLKDDLLNKLE